jgi:6-phosphogluconate dehydrogenase
MKIGFIGLGKMGYNMCKRLLEKDFEIVVYDIDTRKVDQLAKLGAIPANSYRELVGYLNPSERVIWSMLPSGENTEKVLEELLSLLDKNDIIIDGSNSHYKKTMNFYDKFSKKGIFLLDAGVSGGILGQKEGYCIMVGGDEKAFKRVEKIFEALAVENGYRYVGTGGAGHYVKMIHNAIEYGMMASIAEGLAMLKKGPFKSLDLINILDLWDHGSIIRSFLLRVTKDALEKEEDLESILPYVEDTGEGRWAVQTAIDYKVPIPTITSSLMMRFISQDEEGFAFKILALTRHGFGGHAIKRKE